MHLEHTLIRCSCLILTNLILCTAKIEGGNTTAHTVRENAIDVLHATFAEQKATILRCSIKYFTPTDHWPISGSPKALNRIARGIAGILAMPALGSQLVGFGEKGSSMGEVAEGARISLAMVYYRCAYRP